MQSRLSTTATLEGSKSKAKVSCFVTMYLYSNYSAVQCVIAYMFSRVQYM